ncbi:MAG TPA: phosphoribosylanthranilate isomerase [Bryobacteraceae bacterium]
MIVKICGITRREDAEAAVEAGASALGFVFYPKSPRYVTPEQAEALGRGLDVWKVGVFVDETAATIEATMRTANLDVAQIYGNAAPTGVRTWKATRVREVRKVFKLTESDEPKVQTAYEAVLLDGPANGEAFEWSLVRGLGQALKLVVAGGLDASNIAEAIRIARPWGVDASSRLESSPGVKDREKVRRFIEAALSA